MKQKLVSKVWNIKGLFGRVIPGILVWDNGRVIFITEEGIKFNVTLSQLTNIKYPFLRMGLGFDTVVNGEKFKFSFSKPNPGAPEIEIVNASPYPRAVFAGQYFNDISSLKDLKKDRATTREWKEILEMK